MCSTNSASTKEDTISYNCRKSSSGKALCSNTISLTNSSVNICELIGLLYNKNFIKAKQYLQPALNIKDKTLDIYLRSSLALGISLYFLQENQQAVHHLLEIEEINAGFEQERLNFYLAESYFALENFQEALRRYALAPASIPWNIYSSLS